MCRTPHGGHGQCHGWEARARPAANALPVRPLPPHLAQRGVAARIARVASQALTPVEAWVASGVPILLEVQAWMSGGRQGVSGGCGYHPGGRGLASSTLAHIVPNNATLWPLHKSPHLSGGGNPRWPCCAKPQWPLHKNATPVRNSSSTLPTSCQTMQHCGRYNKCHTCQEQLVHAAHVPRRPRLRCRVWHTLLPIRRRRSRAVLQQATAARPRWTAQHAQREVVRSAARRPRTWPRCA